MYKLYSYYTFAMICIASDVKCSLNIALYLKIRFIITSALLDKQYVIGNNVQYLPHECHLDPLQLKALKYFYINQ